MACVRPIAGYRTASGKVTVSRKDGYIDRPVSIACGQCVGCRVARSHAWALRCTHEAQATREAGRSSCFVTLTYDPQHLPKDLSLNVRDWQLFAKKLRKRKGAFRFYMCGEYGDQNLRPHYHALVFGHDFSEDRIYHSKNAEGNQLYMSPELQGIWGKGHVLLGDITWQSAAYCAGYIVTKNRADSRKYRRNDGVKEWYVRPEFSLMSRRPGIGATWFEKYGSDAFPSDFLIHDGRRRRVPKYYDRLQAEVGPTLMDDVVSERVKRARKAAASLTSARLEARELILEKGLSPKVL